MAVFNHFYVRVWKGARTLSRVGDKEQDAGYVQNNRPRETALGGVRKGPRPDAEVVPSETGSGCCRTFFLFFRLNSGPLVYIVFRILTKIHARNFMKLINNLINYQAGHVNPIRL